jgi:hypothetical protein
MALRSSSLWSGPWRKSSPPPANQPSFPQDSIPYPQLALPFRTSFCYAAVPFASRTARTRMRVYSPGGSNDSTRDDGQSLRHLVVRRAHSQRARERAACESAAAYKKPGECSSKCGGHGNHPHRWRDHRRTSPRSFGGQFYPTATPAAVHDVREFSKPKPAGKSVLVSNPSTEPFARTESTPPSRHHSASHQRWIAADYTPKPFAGTEPTPPSRHHSATHQRRIAAIYPAQPFAGTESASASPARHQPAAYHTRDCNLATKVGRSRRPGGRGLRVGPMCGSRRVPDPA